jgi:6-pyruvoyltetrahydropterin/6-carboxytetrahydropterin synthase
MPAITLTRRYRFASSHRLHSPLLSDAENRAVYGKCNNPHGHGHDYILDVSVAGEPDPVTGRLLPLAHLDELVRRVILAPMDRRDLNSEIDEFTGLVPTTENLAIVIAGRLESAWARTLPGAPARLDKIRIHETKNNIFQIRVPDPAPSLSLSAEAANEESGSRPAFSKQQSANEESQDGLSATTKVDENADSNPLQPRTQRAGSCA